MNDMEKARETRDAREKYPAERARLIACFEEEKCPTCEKNAYKNNDERNGFCGEKCYQEYIKKDPMNENNLNEAEGEYAYKHSTQNPKNQKTGEKEEESLKKVA